MAVMYPKQMPLDCRSNAERKVFFALKDLLSDDYTVFYSVPMYREDQSGGLADGEIDFLLAHPDLGLIVLEVKGGGIEHEPESHDWFSIDSSRERHAIKNPFEQAKRYKYLLLNDLKMSRLTGKFTYPLAHAVWFPDIDLRGRPLGLSTQIEKITLDARALDAAANAVPRLFADALGDAPWLPPGNAGISALVDYLAPHWTFSPTLSARFHDDNRTISEATKGQYGVLSLLTHVPRALIAGCAGSGKTLLALEKAHRIAASGGSVLLLCFNKKLAAWLQKQTMEGISAFNFHDFCTRFCQDAGCVVPSPDPAADSTPFFEHVLPDALLEALGETDQRFDAVIIDEGQDFRPSWWLPIQETLVDPVNGTLYIFFDDNQSLYTNKREFPFEAPLFILSENCRNTQCIHAEVQPFYRGQENIRCLGPDGLPMEKIVYSDLLPTLRETVKRLIHGEGLNPSDITVLTPVGKNRSQLQEGFSIGNYRLSWNPQNAGQTVLCSTIHGFKGLESPVVIMCELEQVHAAKRNEILYVGMSRARNHLILIQRTSISG